MFLKSIIAIDDNRNYQLIQIRKAGRKILIENKCFIRFWKQFVSLLHVHLKIKIKFLESRRQFVVQNFLANSILLLIFF